MPTLVRFNVACRVDGKSRAVGDEVLVDDARFRELSGMQKKGKAYVQELVIPKSVEKVAVQEQTPDPLPKERAKRKRQAAAKNKAKKRATKKENARSLPGENG